MALKATATLLFPSSALASPILSVRQTTNPDNGTDFDEICNHNNLNTVEAAKDAFERTTAGYHIDSFIKLNLGGNADNWVNEMYQWSFSEQGGVSPMDGCGNPGGCDVDLKCNEFFDKNRAYCT